MNNLGRIAAFIAVVEEGGFAAAARKQGISTAAISRQVSRLESDLKTELLKRTTRKFLLTPIGAQYYQDCKKALALLTDAEMAIAGNQSEATGILSVSTSRYFATQQLLPHLPEFMKLNPQLKIKLEVAENFPDFAAREIDIIFGCSLEGSSDLVRKQVAVTRYVLCASPAYLKKHGTPKIPADLNAHPYITHFMRRPDNVIAFKNNQEVYVEPVLYLNDSFAMCECALQGLGIIKVHDYVVAEALQNGALLELLSEFQESQLPVYLYYQQSRYLQPKIRRFIDFYTS